MSKWLPLVPFVAALSLLACQDDGPVAEGATAPPDEIVGDASADGLSSPANAAAAEASDRAALPPASAGMAWSASSDRRSVAFGPTPANPTLTIACVPGGLRVTRHHPAPAAGAATLSFTGGGAASSLPVRTGAAANPAEAVWVGEAQGDMARAVLRPFARAGMVEITLSGTPSLVTPADAGMHRLLSACLGS